MPEISASETKASVRAMSSGIRHGPRATCLAPAAPVLRISVMTLLLARFAEQRHYPADSGGCGSLFCATPHHAAKYQLFAGAAASPSRRRPTPRPAAPL